MKTLLGSQLHSGEKQLEYSTHISLSYFTYASQGSLVAENRNYCIRESESTQAHPSLELLEARAGTLWSGRNYIIIRKMHQGIHGQRKIPKTLARPHCKASSARNPTVCSSQARLSAPTW